MTLEYYIAAAVILAVYVVALVITFVFMYRQRVAEFNERSKVDEELKDPAIMVYDFMALDQTTDKLIAAGRNDGQITIDDVMDAAALNAEVMAKIETNGIDEVRGNYVPKDF